MKNNWKDFVQFSNSERRGIIALSILAILSATFSYFVPKWVSNQQIENFEIQYADVLTKARGNELDVKGSFEYELNDESLFDSASIEIPEKSISNKKTYTPPVLKLNSVTANQLIKSGLVEPQMAFRIVKFRDGLGGFYSNTQLREVFELTDDLYNDLISKVKFDVVPISKININQASIEELQSHSYISKKLAHQIINFREKYKPFETSDDVLKLYMVDEKLHKKIMPYISF